MAKRTFEKVSNEKIAEAIRNQGAVKRVGSVQIVDVADFATSDTLVGMILETQENSITVLGVTPGMERDVSDWLLNKANIFVISTHLMVEFLTSHGRPSQDGLWSLVGSLHRAMLAGHRRLGLRTVLIQSNLSVGHVRTAMEAAQSDVSVIQLCTDFDASLEANERTSSFKETYRTFEAAYSQPMKIISLETVGMNSVTDVTYLRVKGSDLKSNESLAFERTRYSNLAIVRYNLRGKDE